MATAPGKKLAPLIVSGNPPLPACAELGFRFESVGGGLIVNVAGEDVPPVVVTVMLGLPAAAIRLAGTAAVSEVAPTNVVVSAVVFHITTAPPTK